MDYYIDRLETLHPRLKKTEFVSTLISEHQELRDLAADAEGRVPTEDEVKKMRDLANAIEAVALGPVDSDGKIITSSSQLSVPSARRFLAAVDDANVRAFRGLVDRFLEETHERFPESASRLGLDEFNARLGRMTFLHIAHRFACSSIRLPRPRRLPEASFAATTGSTGALSWRCFALSCLNTRTLQRWRNNPQTHCDAAVDSIFDL